MDFGAILSPIVNPVLGFAGSQLQGSLMVVAVAIFWMGLDFLIKYNPEARKVAKDAADLDAFLIKTVKATEAYGNIHGIKGVDKLEYALDAVKTYLDARGVKGDAQNITVDWAKVRIEAIRASLFPKK